ncbi:sterol glucosyltransferase [Colletotrichum scovillei]|uniref:Sterol glucosyltransferase n=1 Tax=Colletotrichum scovillei TaxID=1209932 RepID=A0A9P7UC57_9PEZI|nr:sterol glucosyltransferase [Colletotrichum scovillei]KAG7042162.1 sterol glucosyltransferase [Colletotrichum scovillei]KAG7062195.1 sterol glucosyltransferase [Colletotrichum scovillei]
MAERHLVTLALVGSIHKSSFTAIYREELTAATHNLYHDVQEGYGLEVDVRQRSILGCGERGKLLPQLHWVLRLKVDVHMAVSCLKPR